MVIQWLPVHYLPCVNAYIHTLGLCYTTLGMHHMIPCLRYHNVYTWLTLIDYNMDKIAVLDLSTYYLYQLPKYHWLLRIHTETLKVLYTLFGIKWNWVFHGKKLTNHQLINCIVRTNDNWYHNTQYQLWYYNIVWWTRPFLRGGAYWLEIISAPSERVWNTSITPFVLQIYRFCRVLSDPKASWLGLIGANDVSRVFLYVLPAS